jgi:prohibitin 1
LELSKSPNAKVVVIGNSETGLPLILDTGSQDLAMPSASELAPLPDFEPLFPDAMKSSGSGDEPAITQDPVDMKAALETGDVQDPQPGSDGPEKK